MNVFVPPQAVSLLSGRGGIGPRRAGIIGRENGVRIALSTTIVGTTYKVQLQSVSGGSHTDVLQLSALELDEVSVTPTDAAVSPELSDTLSPGTVSGASGTKVVGMTSSEANTLYLLDYEILDNTGDRLLFYPSGGPFPSGNPPSTPGRYQILVTSADADAGNAVNLGGGSGGITFGHFSIKRAEWKYTVPGGNEDNSVMASVSFGAKSARSTVFVPTAGLICLSGAANPNAATGAIDSPFREFSDIPAVSAGDEIRGLDDGPFHPITLQSSGTVGNLIRFTAADGANPTIVGDLLQHSVFTGGDPIALDNTKRDGFFSSGNSHFEVDGWHVRECWRNGFVVFGDTPGSPATDVTIRNTTAIIVGASPYRYEGQNSDTLVPASEDNTPRLTDVTDANNVGYWGNIPNDNLNADTETISFANGVDGATSTGSVAGTDELNYVYGDPVTGRSRGYGFDVKVGAKNVTITNPVAKNHTKYAFYNDSGRLWLDNIRWINPVAYNCQIGFVVAREAATVGETFQESYDADNAAFAAMRIDGIWCVNPQFYNLDQSHVFLDAHPRDNTTQAGVGSLNNVNVLFGSMHNGRRVSGSDLNLLDWENLIVPPTNVTIGGNAVWNDEDSVTFAQSMASPPAWMTYVDNLTDQDPLFQDPDNGNFALQSGSPAGVYVTTAGLADAPANIDANGDGRTIPANAGSDATSISGAVETITTLTITGPQANGELPSGATVTGPITGRAWGIGTGSTPSLAALTAGTGMVDFGTVDIPVSGSVDITLADGIDTTGLNLWMAKGDGTVITAAGSVPFAIDTTSPAGTLTAVQTGETTATVSLDLTNEAGDIADFAIYPTASTPSENDIENGTGATWSTQDVTLTAGNTNDQSATGLTASTDYRAHAVIVDAQGQKTTLVTATFTTAGSGFTENAVTLDGTQYLTSSTALPTGQGSGLLFMSLNVLDSAEAATRLVGITWNGNNGGAHVNWTTGNGLVGIRGEIEDSLATNAAITGEGIAVARRYHALWSFWVDSTDLHTICYLYDTVAGTWSEAFNIADPTTGGAATLELSADNLRIFARSDDGSQGLEGDVYRVALWTNTANSAIADITDAGVRNEFIDGASIADPATTQAAYSSSTLHIDLNGDAADYNAGTHDGVMSLTATGTFT